MPLRWVQGRQATCPRGTRRWSWTRSSATATGCWPISTTIQAWSTGARARLTPWPAPRSNGRSPPTRPTAKPARARARTPRAWPSRSGPNDSATPSGIGTVRNRPPPRSRRGIASLTGLRRIGAVLEGRDGDHADAHRREDDPHISNGHLTSSTEETLNPVIHRHSSSPSPRTSFSMVFPLVSPRGTSGSWASWWEMAQDTTPAGG